VAAQRTANTAASQPPKLHTSADLQIDHLPLNMGGMRSTQGRTLAVMQVSGGSQSFNAVNTLRLLGRWMRMVTIPNQSSVAKAFTEFDENGRMTPSSYYDRIVDVMEELVRFTVLTRVHAGQLVDHYSERKASGVPIDAANDLSAIRHSASGGHWLVAGQLASRISDTALRSQAAVTSYPIDARCWVRQNRSTRGRGGQPAIFAQGSDPRTRDGCLQTAGQTQPQLATVLDHAGDGRTGHPPRAMRLHALHVPQSRHRLGQGHQHQGRALRRVHPDVVVLHL
jgi:hypothetical protein